MCTKLQNEYCPPTGIYVCTARIYIGITLSISDHLYLVDCLLEVVYIQSIGLEVVYIQSIVYLLDLKWFIFSLSLAFWDGTLICSGCSLVA